MRSLKKTSVVYILACFIFITDELDDVFQLDETQAEQCHTSKNTCNVEILSQNFLSVYTSVIFHIFIIYSLKHIVH